MLGCIDPCDVGVCLPHEHLFVSVEPLNVPAVPEEKHFEEIPFALENLWWIKRNPYAYFCHSVYSKFTVQCETYNFCFIAF